MDTSPDTTSTQTPVLSRHPTPVEATLQAVLCLMFVQVFQNYYILDLCLTKKNAVMYVCVCDYEKKEEEEEPILNY